MRPELPSIVLGGRRVAADEPPFLVAEIGLNHGGSIDRALALVDAAAQAGAQAIKLQTLVARDLVSPACPAPAHVAAASLVEFFAAFELDEAAHRRVIDRARARGLVVLSTPLSEAAVDLLARTGVDAFKIASGDLTWDQLIRRAAATGKPLVLSTGFSSLAEVAHALDVARAAGARELAVLHCVSAYPVPPGAENLRAIQTLASACRVPVGLSDHSADAFAFPLAVALGGSIYERHLVLEDDRDAVDRAVSSTPAELRTALSQAIRAWVALGTGDKACSDAERPNVVASRRSWAAARPLSAGHVLTPADLVALRPATGFPPAALASLCGRRLRVPLDTGETLEGRHLEPAEAEEGDRVA